LFIKILKRIERAAMSRFFCLLYFTMDLAYRYLNLLYKIPIMQNFFKKLFRGKNKNTEAEPHCERTQSNYNKTLSVYENRSDFPYELQCKIFLESLKVTKAYCDLQLKNNVEPTALALRSINLIINNKKLFEFEYAEDLFKRKQTLLQWTTHPLSENLVPELLDQQLIFKSGIVSDLDGVEKIKGKILIADFDETVVDGASEACSEGFIDVYDLPPIDTWFYLNRNASGWRRIYAWIPAQFTHLVDEAIAVNCVEILNWFEEV
jgi:hypothetical protein